MSQQPANRTDPKKFVTLWNVQYPFDYWWRQKHGIPFGSKQHLEASHIFIYLEWEEEQMFKELAEENDTIRELELPAKGGVPIVKMSKKEIDKEFDDIDLASFNKLEEDGGPETS